MVLRSNPQRGLELTVYRLLATFLLFFKYNFFIIRKYFGEEKILLFSRTSWNTEPV